MSLLNQMMPTLQEGRKHHHKPQAFSFKNGYNVMHEERKGIAGEELASMRLTKERNAENPPAPFVLDPELTYGRSKSSEPPRVMPPFIAYDKVALRFDSYFMESVHESPDETYRVRRCLLEFFPEDNSIMVTEKYWENSGMPLGRLIKRQLLPKNEQEHYGLGDLYCGAELNIYGKVIRIVNCDDFTRQFMTTQGYNPGEAEQPPADAYSEKRRKMNIHERLGEFDTAKLALRKFLANDRKVLRFFGVWDDRASMYGEIHRLVMRYFLVDDTIEIREVKSPNSGIEPFILKRTKLPRHFTDLADIKASPYYTDEDFEIGTVVNVFGRKFEIHDVDQFTRNYYEKMGRDMTGLVEYKWEDAGGETVPALPPYNGFGNEEDTIGNCLLLMPKPPRKDLVKLITKDHKVLRFLARMITKVPEDVDRRFVVSYYLNDDTISIYEPSQRNSGINGGKFLERMKIKLPKEGRYIRASDLYVGGQLVFFDHTMQLLQADEYALNYMEQHPAEFPKSNFQAVINSIRQTISSRDALYEAIASQDKLRTGSLTYEQVRSVFRKFNTSFSDHVSLS
eukprot:TRINITY_DN1772_c0_g1_i1.p1 TRINITY_DN1772_c0_g1~~TRINITY_DN1772_c0_g1_i1.p1  ORF type:complete len:566 (-),score=119.53 TRINITY_DN1772_c0_g1_i1:135-1832(-)